MAMAAGMAMDIAGATVAMVMVAGMLVEATGKGTVADMRDVARDTVAGMAAVLAGATASAVAGMALVGAATALQVAVMVVDGGSLELT